MRDEALLAQQVFDVVVVYIGGGQRNVEGIGRLSIVLVYRNSQWMTCVSVLTERKSLGSSERNPGEIDHTPLLSRIT